MFLAIFVIDAWVKASVLLSPSSFSFHLSWLLPIHLSLSLSDYSP